MALKALATAAQVQSILRTNSIMVEVDGSIRRITLDKFIDSINSGDTSLLRSVAWGVPIKQASQSSSAWGRVGNLDMWALFKSQCGRYLVKNNGHAAKLSVNNSGVYADGTALDESIGHVLFVSPDLYYRVITDAITNEPILWMSLIPIGGKVLKSKKVGAYLGSMAGSALTSRSGKNVAASKTINAFWNAAQVNGAQWGLEDYEFRKLLIMIALSEYGNPNIQACLGNGVGGDSGVTWDSRVTGLLTGATKGNGDAFAANPITVEGGSHCNRVSVLGVEDPYQWYWEMIQGIYFGNSGNSGQAGTEVFLYEGNRMPSSAELASHPSGDYRQLARLTTNGYVSRMILGDFFDVIASQLGAGSTDHWCDYFYGNNTGQLCLWGARAADGADAGLGSAYSNLGWSVSYSYIGSRLAYYGELTVMSGAQLVAE